MPKIKTIVVMPAYNAESTLEKTISDIPFDHVSEIILVDDDSGDKTVELAKAIGMRHPRLTVSPEEALKDKNKVLLRIEKNQENLGYGGNQKNCYDLALRHGADIIIMLHPDYQYDPRLIKYFVEFIGDGYFDVMLGTRIRSRKEALEGGMPPYKYYANRILSFIQNLSSGLTLSEWHTGMRAYKSEVLYAIRFNRFSDDFIFDTQALFAIVEKGFSIGDIPVPVRYFKEASSINFVRSCRYGLLTLWETVKFSIRRSKQFITYVIVGILGVLTNLTIYSLLLYRVHLWYVAAAIIAFCCGAVVSFSLQKLWTFRRRTFDRVHHEIMLYILIISFNSLINANILILLVQNDILGKLSANILSNGAVAIWSFFLYKHLVFKNSQNL